MNPLLQILRPILNQMPRSMQKQFLNSLKVEARAMNNANRMISRGSDTGKTAIRNPRGMFDIGMDEAFNQQEILDIITEDFGGSYDPGKVDDARDKIMNLLRRRTIKRRR